MTSERFSASDLEARVAAIRKLAEELEKLPLRQPTSFAEAERLAEALQQQAASLRFQLRKFEE
jgi:HPt (histidine-containing phosphotransfer) domain-containing protein